MGVLRNILSELVAARKDLKELKKLQDPKLLEKAERLKVVNEALDNLPMQVKSIAKVVDAQGMPVLRVYYQPIVAEIKADKNGHPVFDKRIEAINFLSLIPLEDMKKISEEAKKEFGED